MEDPTQRSLWHLFETVHAVTYFAPRSHAAAAALGMRGFWAGYVVLRSAPLGPVHPAVVTAAFHGFAARRIEKVLPAAWELVDPGEAVDVRARAAVARQEPRAEDQNRMEVARPQAGEQENAGAGQEARRGAEAAKTPPPPRQ